MDVARFEGFDQWTKHQGSEYCLISSSLLYVVREMSCEHDIDSAKLLVGRSKPEKHKPLNANDVPVTKH